MARLAPLVSCANILPLTYFSVGTWQADQDSVLGSVFRQPWAADPLIVRSSTLHEDDPDTLMPGAYLSIPKVRGREPLRTAIDHVVDSYRRNCHSTELARQQVLVQPSLRRTTLSGVAFTCDPNSGASYLVINYVTDGKTDTVTSGNGTALRTAYVWKRGSNRNLEPHLCWLVKLARELESLTGQPNLDFEFAFDAGEKPYLFQVRPMVVPPSPSPSQEKVHAALTSIANKVANSNRRHPYLLGQHTVYGVMPDWNPAEIIGVRPRPLALSLYRRLITDEQWAEQRVRYGYRDVRGFPLLVDFCGLPYVDVRVSCNSLVPAGIEDRVAEKLVDYYVDRLDEEPALHDKVEFDIVFSCYSFGLEQRLAERTRDFLDRDEREHVRTMLRNHTNVLLSPDYPVRRADEESIAALRDRFTRIAPADIDEVSRVYWLLEDCRRLGTLAFAGFARLGFIGAEFLRSLVAYDVLAPADAEQFMATLNTSSNRMMRDRTTLSREEFLARYGFLRPGTYDILSARYDEAPDNYFSWESPAAEQPRLDLFRPSPRQLRTVETILRQHRIEQDAAGLFDFIKFSLEMRENAKFEFSRHLSHALRLIAEFGREHGFSRDDMSYLPVECFDRIHQGAEDPAELLREDLLEGKRRYELTRHIVLPPVLSSPEQVESFHLPETDPHYITQKSTAGPVRQHARQVDDLAGTILFLPSGDPGYDWIFTTGLAGFVTKYGGPNSHMAIRAHQFGVPAVIGTGEVLYNKLTQARYLHIDCVNRRVDVLS